MLFYNQRFFSACIYTGSAPVFTGSILRVKQLGAEFID